MIGERAANRVGDLLRHLVSVKATPALVGIGLLAGALAPFTILRPGPFDFLAPPTGPALSLVLTFLILLSHELGHIAASRRADIRVDALALGIYAIFPAMMTRVSMLGVLPVKERVCVLLGGVLFQAYLNLALLVLALAPHGPALRHWMLVNTVIALLNLLPALRFDGYHIANLLLAHLRGTARHKASDLGYRIFNRLSVALLVGLMVVSLANLLSSIAVSGLSWWRCVYLGLAIFCLVRLAKPVVAYCRSCLATVRTRRNSV